ncbi:MAG: C10 family peptidase [Bacteroidetes bacterium]|nr:C10 family peptidase [Bacteroidota bacterium]
MKIRYFFSSTLLLLLISLQFIQAQEVLQGKNQRAVSILRTQHAERSSVAEFYSGKSFQDVSPMITTTWDQGCFYNEKCPPDATSTAPCYHAFAGSGAVAMAQIMKYYNFPAQGTGSHTYVHPVYGNIYVNFSAATYDWLNMPQALTASNDAVSTLIYHCGVGQEMNYGPDSSASGSALIDTALIKYFSYNPAAIWKWKADYPADQWQSMVRAELDADRPLLYFGNNGGTEERFFICDGYQGTDQFHFNWGAGGTDDGYYYLNDLTPGTHNYTFAQGAIFNLSPYQPASTFKMDFETVADFSLTFSPWTVRDVDLDSTYGIQGHAFLHNGSPMAFIAFNPAMVVPSMASDTALQPHGGNRFGACFSGMHVQNNDWFISPQVQLGTDGQFTFWERSYTDQYGLEKFNVLVSTTDNLPGSFTCISGSTPLTAPLQWTKKTFSLSAYNNQAVYVAIQCVSNNSFIFMIDDLEVKTSSTSNLSADFIASKTSVRAGEKISFTDQSSGSPTSWSWSFPGGFPVDAYVQNPVDIRYDTPGTYDVTLRISDGSGTDSITKYGYITVSGHPSHLSLDFESLPDFTLNFDDWSVYDVNGGITYGIDSVSFPNSGVSMAYICFNPSQATPPPRYMAAHSGNKFGACFSSMPPHNPNNKWLISPEMTIGNDASIELWVMTYNAAYGLEQYNIGVSTTGINPADFVMLNSSPVNAPVDWAKRRYSLAAYAGQDVYIGINCVSNDQFIFMVDDIEIGSALGTDEENVTDGITVFPNPARDQIFITWGSKDMKINRMTLMNTAGAIVKEVPVTGEITLPFRVDLKDLSPGIFYLMIDTEKERIVKKVVIVR